MTDSKRSEILAGIPSGETGNGAIAFVLPYPFSNAKRVYIRDMGRLGGEVSSCKREKKQTGEKSEPNVMPG